MNQELKNAAIGGNLERVKQLVEAGADINYTGVSLNLGLTNHSYIPIIRMVNGRL